MYEQYKKIIVRGSTIVDDTIWMIGSINGGLYRQNIDSGEIELVCVLDDGQDRRENKFSLMYSYEDYIFIMPQNSYSIFVYNIKDNYCIRRDIKCNHNDIGYATVFCCFYKGRMYFFSEFESCDCGFLDLKTMEIELNRNFRKALAGENFVREKYLMNAAILIDSEVVFGLYKTNIVMHFDLETNCISRKEYLDTDIQLDRMLKFFDYILYITVKNIVYVQMLNEPLEKYIINIWDDDVSAIKAVGDKEKIFLIPQRGREIAVLRLSDRICHSLKYDYSMASNKFERVFYCLNLLANNIYIYSWLEGYKLCIDIETGKTKRLELSLNRERSGKELATEFVRKWNFESLQTLYEEDVPLEIYLKFVSEYEKLKYIRNGSKNEKKFDPCSASR